MNEKSLPRALRCCAFGYAMAQLLACSPELSASRGAPNGSGSSGDGDGDGASIGDLELGVPTLDPATPGDGSEGSRGTAESCDATTPCASADEVCVINDANACGGTGDGVGGVCQRVQSASVCTAETDCQGDTRCCMGDCRADGIDEGRCVAVCGVDESCRSDLEIGVFSPSVQCEWKEPPPGDAYPDRNRVFASPIVAQLPYDSGAAAEIIIVASAANVGAGAQDTTATGAVLRVLSGQTCEQVGLIDATLVRDTATPAVADLDGDGVAEIVTRTHPSYPSNANSVVTFRWDPAQNNYVTAWTAASSVESANGGDDWDGISIHNLDNDGCAEIIGRGGEVIDCMGNVVAAARSDIAVVSEPALGDVDADGVIELVANKVFEWTGTGWQEEHPGPNTAVEGGFLFYAFADFGTVSGGTLLRELDGIAEVVVTGNKIGSTGSNDDEVALFSLAGEEVMRIGSLDRGGPPTIGDFDGDGFPEFASADGSRYRVFDPDCFPTPSAECEAAGVLWSQPSDDASSAQTGSSIFDFEADGQAEVVYADECFARIYKGSTGEVLFSAFRGSCTWWESPIVADPDNDTRTEIIVNSNPNCFSCQDHQIADGTTSNADWYLPFVDPLDPGVRCAEATDCASGNCVAGFCRCTTDEECGGDLVLEQDTIVGNVLSLKCAEPPAGGPAAASDGNTCRAQNPNPDTPEKLAEVFTGVRVLRDVLDRWAPSRPLWNQHAYHITHVNSDTTLPSADDWAPNFLDPAMNNYRQNTQGGKADLLPDIAGLLNKDSLCSATNDSLTLQAEVCNRGLRAVGAGMPATFFLGEREDNDVVCVSYTEEPMPEGSCVPVSCTIGADRMIPDPATITMEVNNDGQGMATTKECRTDNNIDSVVVDKCAEVR